MAIPTYDQLMLPLLRLAGAHRASDLPTAEKLLGDEFGLTPDELYKRLFHPRARLRAELVRKAAAALGKRLVVELEDAA